MKRDISDLLERFKVTKDFGFLVHCHDVQLPEEFDTWLEISENLPRYIEDDTVRERILALPVLDIDEGLAYNQLRLLHTYIITLVSAYMWCKGKDEVPLSLPKCLASPLIHISERAGLAPVVSHPSTCLSNWKYAYKNGPFNPESLQLIAFNPLGTKGNEWFFVATAQIEKDFGRAIYAIIECVGYHAQDYDNYELLEQTFHAIESSLNDGIIYIKRMGEHLTPAEFYHKLRPYLWGYNEGALKGKGMIMEGFEDRGNFMHAGASAAQSSTIPLVDAFMNIEHTGADKEFLTSQLEYMPKEHRELIAWVRKNTPVTERSEGRNSVLERLTKFRTEHLSMAAQFIVTQLPRSEMATGTGGTPFMKFLKSVRDDSKQKEPKDY